jgi:hypothetical protein
MTSFRSMSALVVLLWLTVSFNMPVKVSFEVKMTTAL